MREFLTIFLVFILSFNRITAQDSIIEHKIQKGETAYFIAQKYKVSVDEIYKLNPESQSGIKDNQIIKDSSSFLRKTKIRCSNYSHRCCKRNALWLIKTI